MNYLSKHLWTLGIAGALLGGCALDGDEVGSSEQSVRATYIVSCGSALPSNDAPVRRGKPRGRRRASLGGGEAGARVGFAAWGRRQRWGAVRSKAVAPARGERAGAEKC